MVLLCEGGNIKGRDSRYLPLRFSKFWNDDYKKMITDKELQALLQTAKPTKEVLYFRENFSGLTEKQKGELYFVLTNPDEMARKNFAVKKAKEIEKKYEVIKKKFFAEKKENLKNSEQTENISEEKYLENLLSSL